MEQTGKRGRVHGYSFPPSAHSIPWPVACSWKDGDPHYCSIEAYRGKRHASHGRPATLRQEGGAAQARTARRGKRDRERERARSSLFPLQSLGRAQSTAQRTKREPTNQQKGKARWGSKGEQESLPSKRRLLPSFFLASCGEALAALSPPPISLR